MSSAAPSKPSAPQPGPIYTPLAGLLSYLVPGLGQIVQGRVGKGLLFLVCIYTLFFYGMHLGTSSKLVDNEEYRVGGNVYLPDNMNRANPFGLRTRILANLYNRPQFLAQFWVGIAAWPAIWQYRHYDEREETQLLVEARHQNTPAEVAALEKKLAEGDPVFGQYQRAPSETARNAIDNAGDKQLDLGWVYTVIAGVLNIMVIYDAMAGPAFPSPREQPSLAAA